MALMPVTIAWSSPHERCASTGEGGLPVSRFPAPQVRDSSDLMPPPVNGVKGFWVGEKVYCRDLKMGNFEPVLAHPKRLMRIHVMTTDLTADPYCGAAGYIPHMTVEGPIKEGLYLTEMGDKTLRYWFGTLLGNRAAWTFDIAERTNALHGFSARMCAEDIPGLTPPFPVLDMEGRNMREREQTIIEELAKLSVTALIDAWGAPHENDVHERGGKKYWVYSTWFFESGTVHFNPASLSLQVVKPKKNPDTAPRPAVKANDL